MRWTIQEIKAYPEGIMPISGTIDVTSAIRQRNNKDVIDVKSVSVSGYLTSVDKEIIVHATILADLVLASTRTMNPVDVKIEVPLKERYVDSRYANQNIDEYEETTISIKDDMVDLEQAVADLVVLNLPQRVIGSDEDDDHLPVGDDWEVITEEDYLSRLDSEETIDPRLAKLQELLNNEEQV